MDGFGTPSGSGIRGGAASGSIVTMRRRESLRKNLEIGLPESGITRQDDARVDRPALAFCLRRKAKRGKLLPTKDPPPASGRSRTAAARRTDLRRGPSGVSDRPGRGDTDVTARHFAALIRTRPT